jgi:hypothetical protein
MLRESPCQKGTIETLFYEPCGERWRISKLKCTAPYHPKVLFEEVASRLQNDVYNTTGWEIHDDDGKVDVDSQREPRDGERYIILSPEVSEELRSSMNARFKKFLQTTRWRGIKSRYKIEVFQEDPKEEPGFETVEEAIHRKHVRYRIRWKQKRKILAQPVESSPLCNDFISPDESSLQDQIQAPTHSGWGRVGPHVESPFERRGRDRRSGKTERGEPGDFETQPSHSGVIEDLSGLKRQEELDSKPLIADAQLFVHDHDIPTSELVRPLREDSELDDRLQTPCTGTEGVRTRLSESDEFPLRQSRVNSKVAEGKPSVLKEESLLSDQANSEPALESADQSELLFSEEELDPAPQAPVVRSSGYFPRTWIKSQEVKRDMQPKWISPVFSASKDQLGVQIPETSQEQLAIIEETNRRQKESISATKPSFPAHERTSGLADPRKSQTLLQIRGEQPPVTPRAAWRDQKFVLRPFDPYQNCLRIPVDLGKEYEPEEDETEEEIEWFRNWARSARAEWERSEMIRYPDGHWVLVSWPKKKRNTESEISMNIIGQSSNQEIETVETHTLQGSEEQLRKPTLVVRADVIAARCSDEHNLVNARSDDLLALQAENRLELDLSGKAEVISSLKEDLGPDFQVSQSTDHPNCSLVRPVNPEPPPDSPALLKLKTRRKEMQEIEHFLSRDWKFYGLVEGLRSHKPEPSPERDVWISQYFKGVCRNHNFKEDQSLFNSRCHAVCDYISLWDEDLHDKEGALESQAELNRNWKSCHFVPERGWVYSSLHPYNLGQC